MLGFRPLSLVVAALFLTGCGGDGRPALYRVSGTVNHNGTPLTEATIVFEPVATGKKGAYSRPSTAVTDAQGKFTLATYSENDGVPVGKYRVAVIKQKVTNPPGMNPEMATPEQLAQVVVENLIPANYAVPDASGLTVEVTASGMKPAVIELTGAPGGVVPK